MQARAGAGREVRIHGRRVLTVLGVKVSKMASTLCLFTSCSGCTPPSQLERRGGIRQSTESTSASPGASAGACGGQIAHFVDIRVSIQFACFFYSLHLFHFSPNAFHCITPCALRPVASFGVNFFTGLGTSRYPRINVWWS